VTDRRLLLRDERVLSALVQLAVGFAALALVWLVAANVLADLRDSGLAPGLGFLRHEAGFGISEGIRYSETDSYGRAFVVGLANTLRVSVLGVVLATGLGLAVALARLSGNPLAAAVATGYIELFRNTPLLVQLVFWYRGVVLRLPGIGDSLALRPQPEAGEVSALALLSQRGLALPAAEATSSTAPWLAASVLALTGATALIVLRRPRAEAATRAVPWWTLLVAVAIAAAAWAILPEPGLRFELPTQTRFRYQGGVVLSPEFVALLVGLVAYTGAFIAEVVRAGIQAVDRGQREAALALGLRGRQVLRRVVLPQALRVIVPPLTSQYLNLTKNSSLAIAIAFPDLFSVGQTIGNQTGQFVIVTALIMAFYLAISLLTSLAMSLYGRRIRLVGR
jgi:general L-amino acid transport system permease protein